MTARLAALVVWAAVAASAVFWALRLFVTAPPLPAGTAVAESAQAARGDVVRLLGAAPVQAAAQVAAPPPESSRFRLSGVMAPRGNAPYGVALIAVDGKPPRAFRVGSRVDGDLVLQSVTLRTATVGAAGGGDAAAAASAFKMEMPPLLPANTGSLPPIGFDGVPGVAAQPGLPPLASPEPPLQNMNDPQMQAVPMQQAPPPAMALPQRSPVQRGAADR